MQKYTFSTKRRRAYPRKFDHEKAIEMYEKGFNYKEIARHLGNTVTDSAVARVVNPEVRAKTDAYSKAFLMSGVCPSCGGRMNRYAKPDGSGLCKKCLGITKQTRFRFDENGEIIEMRCGHCQTWKTPDHFCKSVNDSRGLRDTCRACDSARRQLSRQKRKRPCLLCGKLATNPKDKGPRGNPYPICHSCSIRTKKKGQQAGPGTSSLVA